MLKPTAIRQSRADQLLTAWLALTDTRQSDLAAKIGVTSPTLSLVVQRKRTSRRVSDEIERLTGIRV